METKHTPGPWRARRSTEFVHGNDGPSDYWFIESGNFDRGPIVSPKVRNQDDARLIAAAPEMLYALELLSEKLRELKELPDGFVGAVSVAAAAINKAKGK
jgi:hypothetical protein